MGGIPKGGVKGYTDVSGGESGLLSAVAERPVSIAVDAAGSNWQMYSGGVMTSQCGTQLDHGVLCVGYGKDGANEYWKVKNSWGTNWGEAGYIRIVRGRNSCGIANGASYPQVNGKVPPAPPTPPTPPSPTPTPPSPGCHDDFPECSSWPCEFFANVCRKHCGCCGPNPPSNCVSASAALGTQTIWDDIKKLICQALESGMATHEIEELVCSKLKYSLEITACDKVVPLLISKIENDELKCTTAVVV